MTNLLLILALIADAITIGIISEFRWRETSKPEFGRFVETRRGWIVRLPGDFPQGLIQKKLPRLWDCGCAFRLVCLGEGYWEVTAELNVTRTPEALSAEKIG